MTDEVEIHKACAHAAYEVLRAFVRARDGAVWVPWAEASTEVRNSVGWDVTGSRTGLPVNRYQRELFMDVAKVMLAAFRRDEAHE
jgi:hypothetical protein